MSDIHNLPQLRAVRSHPPGIRPNAARARPQPDLRPVRVVEANTMPTWIPLTIAAVIAGVIGTSLWFGVGEFQRERDAAVNEAEFWREMALAPERTATVRLQIDGKQFKCSQFHIRPEWEPMVAAECAVMGELLTLAADNN